MSATSMRRIQKELSDIRKEPIQNIQVDPNESDLTEWTIIMNGPVRGRDPVKYVSMNLIACLPALHQPKTPYKGGKFKLKVKFGDSYPFKAPTHLHWIVENRELEAFDEDQHW
ncbi:hypothetical protein QFC24_002075 [Naganishia onofrii]|uniref:Uncharacterized protein n=1 Tax=Naganishia onofrii TaxID=1851511 RepID=A0ACC2XSX4_9TREE|nr:hypothetical protein QFC24_002075 [Naganishia onofrii]